jgi:hypothetical protein
MIEIVIKVNRKSKTMLVCDIFNNPPRKSIKFGEGSVGAEAASRYISGFVTTKMMRFLAASAPQH